MQTFIDTATGKGYAFDPDVIVTQEDGVYVFTAAHGVRLDVPATLVPGELPPPPEPQPITILAPRDYLKRFTFEEYAAARTGSIALQYSLDHLIAAQYVDLNDPEVEAGLDLMIAEGIITEARKAELLAPVENP